MGFTDKWRTGTIEREDGSVWNLYIVKTKEGHPDIMAELVKPWSITWIKYKIRRYL